MTNRILIAKFAFLLAAFSFASCVLPDKIETAADTSTAADSTIPEVHNFYFYYPPDVLKDIEKLYQKNDGSRIYEVNFMRIFLESARSSDITVRLKKPNAAKPEMISYNLLEDFFENKSVYDKDSFRMKLTDYAPAEQIVFSEVADADVEVIFKNSEKIIALLENKSLADIGVQNYSFSFNKRALNQKIQFTIQLQTDLRRYVLIMDKKGNVSNLIMYSRSDDTQPQPLDPKNLKNLNQGNIYQ